MSSRNSLHTVSPSDESVMRIRPTHVLWREVDGEVIALDLSSSTYFTTNKTGAVLWHAMINGATASKLVELLRSTFDISDEVAQVDVRSFLQLLRTNRLLDQAP